MRSTRPLFWFVIAACSAFSTPTILDAGGSSVSSIGPGPWSDLDPADPAAMAEWVRPERYRPVRLDRAGLDSLLGGAPHEDEVPLALSGARISLPMPDGSHERFRFVESPVMAPELAARFPQIRTFVGRGIDEPAASLRFDRTPHGFHAQILSPRGSVYIDPLRRGDITHYASYYRHDRGRAEAFQCASDMPSADEPPVPPPTTMQTPVTGGTLRTYSVACAATGEYTQFHGGTVADGLAAVTTTINRVTGIYEIDASIRLRLISQNFQAIYTNPATDPYTNLDTSAMLLENEANLISLFGGAYDIGHVFGTGDGGAAWWGACNAFRARGVSGLASPVGDSFDVDIVAHEMGHQFRSLHTWNGVDGSCAFGGWSPSTAYEPGSGSTIMSYAGICGADNVVPGDADPYFHGVSVAEIADYSQNQAGANCPSASPTGNAPPSVDVPPGFAIPRLTPFVLTATGSDPDGDTLTYAWEEFDLGPQAPLSAVDDGNIPLFRSVPPSTDPSRTLPRLADVLDGVFDDTEKLPSLGRTMRFRVTVRDNNPAGGGVAFDETFVTVEPAAGPFTVTGPAAGEIWVDSGLVTWEVAGTDLAPIGATQVDILLSTDGGSTFDTVLESATPNDGIQEVSVGDILTTEARVRVQASDNIFFDINPGDFAILVAPDEVSPAGATVPLRMGLDDQGTLEFELLPAADLVYHLYRAADLPTLLAGDWTTKFCDLASGTTGSWNPVDETTARWTPASPEDLPDGYWVVVADRLGLEGPYGFSSSGAPRPPDDDGVASEANFGCP